MEDAKVGKTSINFKTPYTQSGKLQRTGVRNSRAAIDKEGGASKEKEGGELRKYLKTWETIMTGRGKITCSRGLKNRTGVSEPRKKS